MKPDIRSYTLPQLEAHFNEQGEKKFRARQIYEWLWQKQARRFDDMTNLSKPLRARLEEDFTLETLEIAEQKLSKDGTIKVGFRLPDGEIVEGVLIPADGRVTACVSSQVGCSLTCKFCATGYMRMKRNLQDYEIFDQVYLLRQLSEEKYGQPLSNIVYMGMGEPLLNYRNVLSSIDRLTSPDGMGIASRRITVSTAGVAKMIHRLGDDRVKFEFALSLHATSDAKRSEMMPINETNSLEALGDALIHFYEQTGTRVTYEYILFDGFNDSMADARRLLAFCQIIPCKVNIIEYNPIAEAGFRNSTPEATERFTAYLESRGVIVNVRRSRGRDVDGACGQLALRRETTSA